MSVEVQFENDLNVEAQRLVERDLIVGNEDCKISELTILIEPKLSSKWQRFCILLDCSGDDIRQWTKDLNLKTLDMPTLCTYILEDWRSRNSTRAKLTILLQVLKTLGMVDTRDTICRNFSIVLPDTRESAFLWKLKEKLLPNKNRCVICKMLIFGVCLLCLMGVCLSPVVIFWLMRIHNPSNNTDLVLFDQNQTLCDPLKPIRAGNAEGAQRWLNVSSFEEFRLQYPILHNYSSIYIKLEHPSHWTENIMLGCTIKEVYIAGNFRETDIVRILENFSNLEMITIDTSNRASNAIFSVIPHSENLPTKFPNLKSVTLIYAEDDMYLLNVLLRTVELSPVESIKLLGISIDDKIVNHLNSMLMSAKFLKYLEIWARLKISGPLFKNNQPSMYMQEIILNVIDDKYDYDNPPLYDLGDNFCNRFPNLVIFNSSFGAIKYTSRYQILQCEQLQSLEITFYINTNGYISIGLYERLPRLVRAKIGVEFAVCPVLSKLKGLRDEKISNEGSSIKICSTRCELDDMIYCIVK